MLHWMSPNSKKWVDIEFWWNNLRCPNYLQMPKITHQSYLADRMDYKNKKQTSLKKIARTILSLKSNRSHAKKIVLLQEQQVQIDTLRLFSKAKNNHSLRISSKLEEINFLFPGKLRQLNIKWRMLIKAIEFLKEK